MSELRARSHTAAAASAAASASVPQRVAPAASPSPARDAPAPAPAVPSGAARSNPCVRAWRYLLFVPLLLSLGMMGWAGFAASSSNYTHPRAILDRAWHYASGASGSSAAAKMALASSEFEYPAHQSCEMSYFHLVHKLVTITQLTSVSQQLLEGRIRYGDATTETTAAAAPDAKTAPVRSRRSTESDEEAEEDALLAAAEQAELDAAAAAAAESSSSAASDSSPSDRILRSEFLTLRSLALHALPASVSANSTKRYRVWQYMEHGRTRDLEKYQRELHPLSTKARERRSHKAAAAAGGKNQPSRIPVIFLHGNAGSYHQMRSLASRLNTIYATDRDDRIKADPKSFDKAAYERTIPDLNDYYALDMHEESVALNGQLLWSQAWFANEALSYILAAYPNSTRAIVVAHSMGGIVARIMPTLTNHPRDAGGAMRLSMIVTLGTPHRSLGLIADEWMQKAYWLVNDRPMPSLAAQPALNASLPFRHLSAFVDPRKGLHYAYAAHSALMSLPPHLLRNFPAEQLRPPILISVGGGERDVQVESTLTDLTGIYDESLVHYTLSLAAHSMQYGAAPGESGGVAASQEVQELLHAPSGGVITSVDHQCLAWCKQLVETLTFSVRDMTIRERNWDAAIAVQRAKFGLDRSDYTEPQRQIWIAPAVETLRSIAALPLVGDAAHSSAPHHWPLYAENFTSASVLVPIAPRVAQQGLLLVWVGLMSAVDLCDSAGQRCVEQHGRVQLLTPQMHPSHRAMTEEQRVAKRIGIGSTYMLLIPASTLSGGPFATGGFTLRLTQHDATRVLFATVRSLRSTRGGSKKPLRQIGSILSLGSLAFLPLLHDRAELPHRAGFYRWEHTLPAGLDSHWSLSVDAGGNPENEYGLPRIIALFSVSSGEAASSHGDAGPSQPQLTFAPASFSDQLFTFHASSSKSLSVDRKRLVHFYRAGVVRKAVGLIVRLPEMDGMEDAGSGSAASSSPLRLQLTEHKFVSFLHTLALQLPLLPQMLLGVALLSFAAQLESLRRHGFFPRLYQLFVLPASSLAGLLRSPVLWIMPVAFLAFHMLWHGSLVGEGVLSNPLLRALRVAIEKAATEAAADGGVAPSPLSAEAVASVSLASRAATGPAALWTGWRLSHSKSWLLGLAGSILAAACLAVLIALECLVYALMSGGRWAFSLVWRLISAPLKLTGDAARDGPQKRYFARLCHRVGTCAWIVLFALALVFCLCIGCVALDRLLYWSLPLVALDFVATQSVAWLSTILMVFRLIDAHFFWDSNILPTIVQWTTIPLALDLVQVVIALALLACVLHTMLFPALGAASAAASGVESRAAANARSNANYKSSGLLLLLLLSAVFVLPHFVSSFRLERTESSATSADALLFQPPAAARSYAGHLVAASGTGFSVYDDPADAGTSAVPFVYLPPFRIVSSLEPHALVALCWVALLSLCLVHQPFVPPALQGAVMGLYGLALLLVPGAPTSFVSLQWVGAMLCLCMMPHAMASVLFVVHLIIDRMHGTEGQYQQWFEQEAMAARDRSKRTTQPQQQQPQQPPRPAVSAAKRTN